MIWCNWERNDWISISLHIWDDFHVISSQILTKKNYKGKLRFTAPNLGIFTYIPAYSGITRFHSGIFWALCNPGILRTLVYLESWHIQSQRDIPNVVTSKTLTHSEPETYSKSNPGKFRTRGILRTLSSISDGGLWKTANGHNYFRKLQIFCYLFITFDFRHFLT